MTDTQDVTTTTTKAKEASMTNTFTVTCPCGCGEPVTATDAGFSATTVTVAACSKWAANGITTSKVRKSWAFSHEVTSARPVSHVSGLVVFS